jgi:hypothetical protein
VAISLLTSNPIVHALHNNLPRDRQPPGKTKSAKILAEFS